jgi:hypothetical protein
MAYMKYPLVVCLSVSIWGPATAGEECPNELWMFERDVRASREMKERVFWQLVGANYRRRVVRYCGTEERRAGVAKLQLTPEEMKLLGLLED